MIEWRALVIDGEPWPYAVSNHGKIRSFATGKIRKAWRHEKGYLSLTLHSNGRTVHSFVSRFVCLAFHGDPKYVNDEASHLDGTADNNRASNLKWESPTENNGRKRNYWKGKT